MDKSNRLKRIEQVAQIMDNKFELFGIRFGLDPIVGLIPGIGDAIAPLISLYIIKEGLDMGVPRHRLPLMIWNVVLDSLVGSIPLIGDLFDFGFKANIKNLRIIRQYVDKPIPLN